MSGSPGAGWSSLAARRAHNPKVVGSNPTPATNLEVIDFVRISGHGEGLGLGWAAQALDQKAGSEVAAKLRAKLE